MRKLLILVPLFVFLMAFGASAQEGFEKEVIKTSGGDLEITFIGHASLMFKFGGKIIHVDPVARYGDYSKLPKADMIIITHNHPDHFDPALIGKLRTERTVLVMTKICAETVKGGVVMSNGEVKTVDGLQIEAIPAYNLAYLREGKPVHVKGDVNGYVITFGDKRVYIASDTENTPEMKSLKDIDIAFLPMTSPPSSMTPEMVVDAVKAFKPKILFPYHTGETDISKLVVLMKDVKETEVRIHKMK